VGHVFTKLGLKEEHDATLERTIYEAILALEESSEIRESVLGQVQNKESQLRREQAAILRGMLDQLNGRQ
jgi:hypothetical protein